MGVCRNSTFTRMKDTIFAKVEDYDGILKGQVMGFSNFYKYTACSVCRKKLGEDNYCIGCKKTNEGVVAFKVELGILKEDGEVVKVTCFNSALILPNMSKDSSQEDIETQILASYEEKHVIGTYIESVRRENEIQLTMEKIDLLS